MEVMVGWAAIALALILGAIISWVAKKIRSAFGRRQKARDQGDS